MRTAPRLKPAIGERRLLMRSGWVYVFVAGAGAALTLQLSHLLYTRTTPCQVSPTSLTSRTIVVSSLTHSLFKIVTRVSYEDSPALRPRSPP